MAPRLPQMPVMVTPSKAKPSYFDTLFSRTTPVAQEMSMAAICKSRYTIWSTGYR